MPLTGAQGCFAFIQGTLPKKTKKKNRFIFGVSWLSGFRDFERGKKKGNNRSKMLACCDCKREIWKYLFGVVAPRGKLPSACCCPAAPGAPRSCSGGLVAAPLQVAARKRWISVVPDKRVLEMLVSRLISALFVQRQFRDEILG